MSGWGKLSRVLNLYVCKLPFRFLLFHELFFINVHCFYHFAVTAFFYGFKNLWKKLQKTSYYKSWNWLSVITLLLHLHFPFTVILILT